MNTNHAKAIKGLSIAIIVVAALGILASIAMMALGAVTASVVADPEYYGSYYYSYDPEDAYVGSLAVMGVMGGLGVLTLICGIVQLLAGVFGLKGANDPSSMKKVMIWNIIGAVCGLIFGGFVVMVLCIIVAVFAYKDRKAFQGGYYGAPQPGYMPPQQPAAAAPQNQAYQQAYQQQPATPAAPAPQPQAEPVPVPPTVPTEQAQEVQTAAVTVPDTVPTEQAEETEADAVITVPPTVPTEQAQEDEPRDQA